ncbi:MAG: hypothetical protein IKU18_00820 [Bacteroidales bacterium]|nr:hypothetical protein [Bacteroidales bacterium]
MMKGFDFKKILPYVLAIVAFVVMAYAFTPQVLSGKIVNQSDISSWQGMANEILQYNEANPGERALWTNSMFGGMPATSISVVFEGDVTKHLYDALFLGERPASYLLISLVGGFLLMLAFGVNVWLAFLGAVAMTFCAYNMQIIQVGHNAKMVAIAFMPWVLAAVVYAYRKCALWGGVLFALALSFQIKANHPQITYYLAMIIFGYAIWQLCAAIKDKVLPKFIKTSLILLVTGLIGMATNVNNLWPVYEYSQHTMRGGSELVAAGADDAGKKSRSGLDLEYATTWSYGIGETPNLFIPNFNGGASSGELSRNSETYKALKQNGYAAEQIIKALPLYWGPQPFTAGPMYMGAISMFLFILGFFVLKGGLRWWIGGVSLLALMLSWGYHFMPASEFFFKFAPLYNKFRAVSMILVILQVLIPVMGVLALNEVLFNTDDSKICRDKIKKGFFWSLGITGGFCLLFALMPSLSGGFYANSDAQLPNALIEPLWKDRASLLRSDALRSLMFILGSAVVIWLGWNKKLKGYQAVAIVAMLVLVDMWSVGKRYLNDNHFVSQKEFNNAFALRPVDNVILQDTDPDYRVLDLSVNTFNDSYVSYHHKTIGGYSPVKLQRYQDMIEHHISKEIGEISQDMQGVRTVAEAMEALGDYNVLNMLNTKYIVLDGNAAPLLNENAYGNAWFVGNIVKAANANEEIEILGNVNAANEAVVAENFITPEHFGEFYNPVANSRGRSFFFESDTTASIELVSYSPNRMVYKYSSATPNIALFSEIYYAPGWSATLYTTAAATAHSASTVPDAATAHSASTAPDAATVHSAPTAGSAAGTPLEIFRANYILRALALPAGEGEIVFEFAPDSIIKGENYSRIASALLIALILGAVAVTFFRRKAARKQNGTQAK